MTEAPDGAPLRWSDALVALGLLANDRQGLGGIVVRARHGPVRDAWLAQLAGLMQTTKLPANADAEMLHGGLDIVATLDARAPVMRAGLLEAARGGVLLIPGAERVSSALASIIGVALDQPREFALVLLDEGDDEEQPPAALVERCALMIDLNEVGYSETYSFAPELRSVRTRTGDELNALCETAALLGITSARAPLFALRVLRATDLETAVRLVLAPRATAFPQAVESEPPPPPPDSAEREGEGHSADLTDIAIAAAKAALPPGLLTALAAKTAVRGRGGKAGAPVKAKLRGRPVGARAGSPRGGARLALIDTLRAAAPWQRLRGAEAGRVAIRSSDLRIRRFAVRAESTAIFVVDASGSAAFERLAEAKGAVELLLAEAYVKRTQVALVAFRGSAAEVLLPPTRSLARAKRSLADLNGGGGTPLGAGIAAGALLADAAKRAGRTPQIVLMTDGRANVGSGNASAREEAMSAARGVRSAGIGAVLIDIGARPRAEAAELATAMGARYVAMPRAQAETLRAAVAV